MVVARRWASQLASTKASTSFLSKSTNPYFNLALEDWLFRNTPSDIPLLLLYRNRPSVIIGRNQNPWKEINLHAVNNSDVNFVRRRSGGGTVYHDLGNTNYSIMIPRTSFERRPNAELVARAVAKLGPKAEVNERNDIVVDGLMVILRSHVSGSAYKIVNKRAYHHGTMLIDAKLDQLGSLLHNTKDGLVTKGVESVRSAVRNLISWTPDITHDAFVRSVAEEFTKTYGGDGMIQEVDEDVLSSEQAIKSNLEELQTWDWQYGQTPEFTHRLSKAFTFGDVTATITSKHGLITSAELTSEHDSFSESCTDLAKELEGARYGTLDGIEGTDDKFKEDIVDWLREEL